MLFLSLFIYLICCYTNVLFDENIFLYWLFMRELDLLRISTKKKPREIETSEQAALIEWSWLVSFKGKKVGEYITHMPKKVSEATRLRLILRN